MLGQSHKPLLLAAIITIAVTATAGAATVVDYIPLSFSQLSFSTGGVTVTGTSGGSAANVFSQVGSGVGVAGGLNDFTTDRSDINAVLESIAFSFDTGAATGISFNGIGCIGPCEFAFQIEAFAPGGASLGTASPGVDVSLVSALFANAPIASFLVSIPGPANSRGVVINGLVFDAAEVSAVPLPAALPLFGSVIAGVGLLGWWRRRRSGVVAAA